MAKRELLVTLGLDASSYTQNVKKAKAMTKELDSSFNLISSSVADFGKTIDGLAITQDHLAQKIKVASGLTEVYSNRLKETEEHLERSARESKEYAKQIDSLKTKMAGLSESSDAFKEHEKDLKAVTQLYNKAEKDVVTYTNRLDDVKIAYNKIQTEIQSMSKELTHSAEKMSNLSADNGINNLKKDISDLSHEFELNRRSVVDFDKSMTGLSKTQEFYSKNITLNSQLLDKYNSEMDNSSAKIDDYTKELNHLNKELKEKSKILEHLDSQDEGYDEVREEVERLRVAYSETNKMMEHHKERLDTLNKEYKQIELETASLNGSLEKVKKQMKEMATSFTFEKMEREVTRFNEHTINNLSKKLNQLKYDFGVVSNGSENLSSSMVGLSFKMESYNEMLDVARKASNAYSDQAKALVYDQNRLTKEINETEKELEEYKKTLAGLEGSDSFKETAEDAEKLKEKHQQLVKELKDVNQQLSTNEKGMDSMKKEMDSLGNSIEKTKAEMKSFIDSVEFTPIKEDLRSLREQGIEKLENEVKELGHSLDFLEAGLNDMSKSSTALTQKLKILQDVQTKNKSLMLNYSKELDTVTNKIEGLTRETNEYADKLREQERLLKSGTLSSSEYDQLKTSVKELNQSYEESNRELEKNVQKQKELKDKLNSTTNTVESFKNKIKQTSQTLSQLNNVSDIKALDNSIERLDDKFTRLGSRMDVLKSSFKNFDTSIKGAKMEVKMLGQEFTTLGTKLDLQRQKTKAYEQSLSQLQNKQKALIIAIRNMKLSLEGLDNSSPKFQQTINAIARMETELNGVQQEIKETTRDFKQMETQVNGTIVDINNNLRQQATAVGNAYSNIGNTFSQIGGELQQVGSALMPITVGITAMGGAMVKTGMDFQSQMSKVASLTGSTGAELQSTMSKLTESARHWGSQTRYSATEAGQGLEFLVLAGYNAEDAMSALPTVLNTAQAGAMDLGTASDLLTDSLGSLGDNSELTGDKLKDMEIYANQVAKTSTLTNTSVEQLLRSFITVGGQVDNMNIPLSEANVLLGILADQGFKAEQAGNSLNSILINLTQKTGQSAEAMADLGVSAFDAEGNIKPIEQTLFDVKKAISDLDNEQKEVQLANMLGGKVQAKTLMKLLNGISLETGGFTEHYKELKTEIEQAPDLGALENMAKVMNDNLKGDLLTLKSTIEESLLSMFDSVEPQLREFVQNVTEGIKELTDWFNNLSPAVQGNILKFAGFTAIIAPVTMALGLFCSGLGAIIKFLGMVKTGIGLAKTKFLGLGDAVGGAGLTGKLATLSSSLGTVATYALPAVGLAILGLSQALGDNADVLSKLQDKWGKFGTFISGTLEGLNGFVDLFIQKIGIFVSYIPKLLESLKPGGEKPSDVWNKMFAEMELSSKRAMSNINLETTNAIKNMKTMSESELGQMRTSFATVWKEWEQVAEDGGVRLSERLGNQVQNMDTTMIETLRGTSDTMALIFADITETMNVEQATEVFKKNIQDMVNSGQIDITTLQKDFAQSLQLMQDSFEGSASGLKGTAKNMFEGLKESANIDEMVSHITDSMSSLNDETLNQLTSMGDTWKRIFLGINIDTDDTTQEIQEKLRVRLSAIAKENPQFIKQMQEEMKQYFANIPKDAEVEGEKLQQVMNENGVESIEELQAGIESGKVDVVEVMSQLGTEMGKSAEEGAKEGLVTLPESVRAELAKVGVTVNEQGEVIVENMAEKGLKAGSAYVDTLQQELPQLSGVSKQIQDQLSGIDSVRLGNVTKQLSEVNRWLGVVQRTSAETAIQLTSLTLISWGNTTRGLSEVNNWLMRTSNRAKDARTALVGLTNLPFGNTTRGLSEVNNWLMRTTNRAKDSRKALELLTTVPFGKTTKGLSEINKWLTTTTTSAKNTRSALVGITTVGFGGVTKALSNINSWLNTVKTTAGSTKSALQAVSSARPKMIEKPTQEPQTFSEKMNSRMSRMSGITDFKSEVPVKRDLILDYKTSGGFFDMGSIKAPKPTKARTSNENSLVKELVEQNQLLMQLISNCIINVGVNMDGRQVAKASAKFMNEEMNLLDRRKNRLGGVF